MKPLVSARGVGYTLLRQVPRHFSRQRFWVDTKPLSRDWAEAFVEIRTGSVEINAKHERLLVLRVFSHDPLLQSRASMTHAAPFQAVFDLEAALGASWPHIRQAYHDTIRLHERVDKTIRDLTGEDATIVVFGSLGRFEVTAESDIDWTYLIDGQTDLKHQKAALDANKRIVALGEELGKKKAGREGRHRAVHWRRERHEHKPDAQDSLVAGINAAWPA